MTWVAESLRHPVSICPVVSLQQRYATWGLMEGQTTHACRWWMPHMVMPVTPHGHVKFGYAISVSWANRRPAVQAVRRWWRGIVHALGWCMACVVDQGFFTASAYENSSYPQSRSRGSLQRPAALRLDDYGRKSPWMYIARRRQQFRLRIQQMEVILASILDVVHRLTFVWDT